MSAVSRVTPKPTTPPAVLAVKSALPPQQPLDTSKSRKELNEAQTAKLNAFLDPIKEYTLHPKGKGDIIKFTIPELLKHLTNKLKEAELIKDAPCLTGGALGHVLTDLEYADIDINYFINVPAFHLIKGFFQEFIADKLKKKLNRDLELYIDEVYLYNKTENARFSYIGLGEVEFKFIRKEYARWHVSTSEKLLIPLMTDEKKPSYFCYGAEDDLSNALSALRHRELVVENPSEVNELLFRVLHKLTQGFKIVTNGKKEDVIKIAFDSLKRLYPPTNYELFKTKLLKQLEAHYPHGNQAGKMLYCLNFLSLLQKLDDIPVRTMYTKWLVQIFKETDIPLLNTVAKVIENAPEKTSDFLAIVRGIYLTDFVCSNNNVTGFTFPFSKTPTSPHPHFCLQHKWGKQYLALDQNPLEIAENFFNSWRKLNVFFAQKQVPVVLDTLARELGVHCILSEGTRPVILAAIVDGPFKQPLATTLAVQYEHRVAPFAFCDAINQELGSIEKETPDIFEQKYFKRKLIQLQLQYHLKRESNLKQLEIANLIAAVLTCQKKGSKLLATDIKRLSAELANNETFKLLHKKDDLINVICNALQLFVETSSNKSELAILDPLHEMLQTLQTHNRFSISFRRGIILAYLNNRMKIMSSGDTETALPFYKFLINVRKWTLKSEVFEKYLADIVMPLSQIMLKASSQYALNQGIEQAFYCLSAAINEHDDLKKDPSVQKACLSMIEVALSQQSIDLKIPGTITCQFFSGILIDAPTAKMFLQLANKLINHSENPEYSKIGFKLLAISSRGTNVELVCIQLLKMMSEILASNRSTASIHNCFDQCVKIISKMPHVQKHQAAFVELLTLMHHNFPETVKRFIGIIAAIDPAQAYDIAFSTSLAKLLKETDRDSIIWDLIENHLKIGSQNSIESAYVLWKSAISKCERSLTLAELDISLRVALTISETPSGFTAELGDQISRFILEPLKTANSGKVRGDEVKKLTQSLVLLVKDLLKIGSETSLKLAGELGDSAFEGNVATKMETFQIFHALMQTSINQKRRPPLTLFSSYFRFAQFLPKGSPIHEDVIKRTCALLDLRLEQGDYDICSETLLLFVKRPSFDPPIVKLLNAFFTKLSYSKLTFDKVKEFKELINVIIQENALKHVSAVNQEWLLTASMIQNEERLSKTLWQALTKNPIEPNAKDKLFLLFLETCAKTTCNAFYNIVKNEIGTNGYKPLQTLSPEERVRGYRYVFTYVTNLCNLEPTSDQRQKYADFLEALWENGSALLSNDTLANDVREIASLLFKCYIAVKNPLSCLKACKMIEAHLCHNNISTILDFLQNLQKFPPEKISKDLMTSVIRMMRIKVPELLRKANSEKINLEFLKVLKNLVDKNDLKFTSIVHAGICIFIKSSVKDLQDIETEDYLMPTVSKAHEKLAATEHLRQTYASHEIIMKFPLKELSELIAEIYQKLIDDGFLPIAIHTLELLVIKYFNKKEFEEYGLHILEKIIKPFITSLKSLDTNSEKLITLKLSQMPIILTICRTYSVSLGRQMITCLLKRLSKSFVHTDLLANLLQVADEMGFYSIDTQKDISSEKYVKEFDEIRSARIQAGLIYVRMCCQTINPALHASAIEELLSLSDIVRFDAPDKEYDAFLKAAILVHENVLMSCVYASSNALYLQYLTLFSKILTFNIQNEDADKTTHKMKSLASSLASNLQSTIRFQTIATNLCIMLAAYTDWKKLDPVKVEAAIRSELISAKVKYICEQQEKQAQERTMVVWSKSHSRIFGGIYNLTILTRTRNEFYVKVAGDIFSVVRNSFLGNLEELINSEAELYQKKKEESRTARLLELGCRSTAFMISDRLLPRDKEDIRKFLTAMSNLCITYAPGYIAKLNSIRLEALKDDSASNSKPDEAIKVPATTLVTTLPETSRENPIIPSHG